MARITTHEKVCAERYLGIANKLESMVAIDEERHGGINARLKRMESLIVSAIGGSVGAMLLVLLRAAHLL